jgi:hypothetical protein
MHENKENRIVSEKTINQRLQAELEVMKHTYYLVKKDTQLTFKIESQEPTLKANIMQQRQEAKQVLVEVQRLRLLAEKAQLKREKRKKLSRKSQEGKENVGLRKQAKQRKHGDEANMKKNGQSAL